jgi:hypothetical protein
VQDKSRAWLIVIIGGKSLVSHAGGALLVETARRSGLAEELSRVLLTSATSAGLIQTVGPQRRTATMMAGSAGSSAHQEVRRRPIILRHVSPTWLQYCISLTPHNGQAHRGSGGWDRADRESFGYGTHDQRRACKRSNPRPGTSNPPRVLFEHRVETRPSCADEIVTSVRSR